jgi:hypothetical protein
MIDVEEGADPDTLDRRLGVGSGAAQPPVDGRRALDRGRLMGRACWGPENVPSAFFRPVDS